MARDAAARASRPGGSSSTGMGLLMGQYLDSRPLPGGHYLAGLAGCPRGTAQEVKYCTGKKENGCTRSTAIACVVLVVWFGWKGVDSFALCLGLNEGEGVRVLGCGTAPVRIF